MQKIREALSRSIESPSRQVWAAVAVTAFVLALALIALRSSGSPDAGAALPRVSPSPTELPSEAARTTSSPTQGGTSRPEGSNVWLIDVASDSVRLIKAPTLGPIIFAGFDPAQPQVVLGLWESPPSDDARPVLLRFSMAGRQIERSEWQGIPWRAAQRCTEIRSFQARPPEPGDPPSLVEVGGRQYEGIACGPISPDGHLMTYWAWGDPAQGSAPLSIDQWVIELGTGERHIVREGLQHCGGCDSVPAPNWSPTGRYLYFSDVVGGGGRFFLADVIQATSRQVTDVDRPVWSPAADVLLYPDGAGSTLIERLEAGSRAVLRDVRWPARFDPSGMYIYSPAWSEPASTPGRTSVFDAVSGTLVAELPGEPEQQTAIGAGAWPEDPRPLLGLPGDFVAALQGRPACDGTAIYRSATFVACVEDAIAPQISPDGTKIALARRTGEIATSGPCPGCPVREIVVIDTVTGSELVATGRRLLVIMVTRPVTSPAAAVEYSWNPESTHLVVSGPGP